LKQAVALYRGPLLEGCTELWAVPERTAREQAYLTALETLAARTAAQGDHAAAIPFLRSAIAADPYRESAHRALMQALAEGGDDAAVTQVYRELRLLLRRELNAEAAPETVALYQRLKQGTGNREQGTAGSRQGTIPTLSPQPSAPSPQHTKLVLPRPFTPLVG